MTTQGIVIIIRDNRKDCRIAESSSSVLQQTSKLMINKILIIINA